MFEKSNQKITQLKFPFSLNTIILRYSRHHTIKIGERPEAMQTGSSISPTSTCFLTTTIALLIGSFGALSGNCKPFPSAQFYRTLYDLQFVWPRYLHKQATIISIIMLAIILNITYRRLQILAELPSGWLPHPYRQLNWNCKLQITIVLDYNLKKKKKKRKKRKNGNKLLSHFEEQMLYEWATRFYQNGMSNKNNMQSDNV